MVSDGTIKLTREAGELRMFRRRFGLQVIQGPDSGRSLVSAQRCVTVGTEPNNDLVLSDSSVSRYHLRVEIMPEGFLLSDLDSTNGTTSGNLRLRQGVAEGTMDLWLGETLVRFSPLAEEEEVPMLAADRFGQVLGQSPAMRELFRNLQAAASRDVTVLLEGDTGTGKELIAREVHQHSPRRDGPLVVIDCGAMPPSLIESELFGHTRGAFTGATDARRGAFEQAHGGTIFLDEIGELDLALQPRLLRALESRQIKRLGESRHRSVDVRVVAATNRDLKRLVNKGAFRADLFYRLAVVHLRVPPLRQRPEDIELLIRHLLPDIAAQSNLERLPRIDAEVLGRMKEHPWPGNVRELRNLLERMVALSPGSTSFDMTSELRQEPAGKHAALDRLLGLPFKEAKEQWVAYFDRQYLSSLLDGCGFNVAEAARRSGANRVHLFRLIKKYGIERPGWGEEG